ncbi:MAG: hypothetical protein Q4Q58_06130 [Thermoplasmata archaeon]|nr:hypothetical protein [Thermoplasmata archaeon]
MAEDFSLAPGARFRVCYRISTARDGSLEGVYKGMAAIASDTALVFDTVDGLAYVSAASVVTMLQLEAAPEAPSKKPSGDDRALYG